MIRGKTSGMPVEINGDQPNEKSKGYLFLACYSKGVRLACILAKPQRPAEKWESFIVEKGEGFRCALIGSPLAGEAGGGLMMQLSYGIG